REVEGVDGQAVAAEAGPGLEAHETERLRRRRVHDLRDVELHPLAELRELVDERDVDRAEDVLEQLRQLRGLGRGNLDDLVHGARVELDRAARALRGQAADDLRGGLGRPVLPAGVDALRREGQVEAFACLQSARLEQRGYALTRRAGVRGRL